MTDVNATSTYVLNDIDLTLPDRREGKVRISYGLPNDQRLFVTTDRLSAFDRVLACVPGKGQVLNELSWWWFDELRTIVENHAVALPHPNVLIGRNVTPLCVEVVVRKAITGVTTTSLWHRYSQGQRVIDGHVLPEGLSKNELLPEAIITPTTKAQAGGHDEPLSVPDVVSRGLVEPSLWSNVCDVALSLFERGSKVADAAGLVLADTKYEFGIDNAGKLLLIDEVHTPDSSRYWEAATYRKRVMNGEEPQSMDKEIVRRAYADLNYRGDGDAPKLPHEVWQAVAFGYHQVFTRLTGRTLIPVTADIQPAITRALIDAGILGSKPFEASN
jgi:phosphoribosylaminoimidazole-succinocarboxamide synthase